LFFFFYVDEILLVAETKVVEERGSVQKHELRVVVVVDTLEVLVAVGRQGLLKRHGCGRLVTLFFFLI